MLAEVEDFVLHQVHRFVGEHSGLGEFAAGRLDAWGEGGVLEVVEAVVAEVEIDEVGGGEVAEGVWGEGRGGVAVDCGVVRLEMGVVEMGVGIPTTPLLLARDWAAVLRTFALVVRKMVFGFLTTLRFAIVVELVGCRRTRRSR